MISGNPIRSRDVIVPLSRMRAQNYVFTTLASLMQKAIPLEEAFGNPLWFHFLFLVQRHESDWQT